MMEKYGQYRDKGSGIAPFFPVPPPDSSPLLLPWNIFLLCIRLPLVTFAWLIWLALVQWTPPGNILRKANLWCIVGIPGVWWIDLQVDGVRRGSLAQTPRGRLPTASQIIASSYTSPLDILYLAAIFDPIFTKSRAGTRLVRPVTIEGALASCFDIPPLPPFNKEQGSIELAKLTKQYPNRIIVVFPESTTSNGRGILRLSPSLLSADARTKIFPVSLRYTPTEIVTPIPGWFEVVRFIWRLNSRPTHCIRVRIGAPTTINDAATGTSTSSNNSTKRKPGYESNFFDTLQAPTASDTEGDDDMTEQERKALDTVADSLARLGRVKRVGLGTEEKRQFVEAWSKSGKRR